MGAWHLAGCLPGDGQGFGLLHGGGRGGHPGLIVDPGGTGDITATHLKTKLGPAPSGLGSPVAYGDLVFRMNQPGVLLCVRITSGEELFKERLPQGIDPAINPAITSDGLIFIASAEKTLVVRAAEKFELLAESNLGDASHASAAVSEGKLILKGKNTCGVSEKAMFVENVNSYSQSACPRRRPE